jgi:predicted Zn-dependent peptidase
MSVRKTVFQNGLVILTEQHPWAQAVSMGVWVPVGSRHERPGDEGLAHFMEHMLFKGTKLRTARDIAEQTDAVGGEFNAFTSREQTCFHMLFLREKAQFGFELLSDILLHASFLAPEVERERHVILQEIAMVEDNPEEMAHEHFFRQTFEGSGLGRSILGTKESVSAKGVQDFERFFHEHYRSSQLIVSVCGNLEHEAVVDMLQCLEGPWPGREEGTLGRAEVVVPQLMRGHWKVSRDIEQTHCFFGLPGLIQRDPKRFALSVLNTHLGGGMSSRLFQEIREKRGLAYSVYSHASSMRDVGLLTVYAGVEEAQVDAFLGVTQAECQRLLEVPLTEKELDRAKMQLKAHVLMASDHVETRMSALARNEWVYGRQLSLSEIRANIDAVTAEEVLGLAEDLWKKEEPSVLIYGP